MEAERHQKERPAGDSAWDALPACPRSAPGDKKTPRPRRLICGIPNPEAEHSEATLVEERLADVEQGTSYRVLTCRTEGPVLGSPRVWFFSYPFECGGKPHHFGSAPIFGWPTYPTQRVPWYLRRYRRTPFYPKKFQGTLVHSWNLMDAFWTGSAGRSTQNNCEAMSCLGILKPLDPLNTRKWLHMSFNTGEAWKTFGRPTLSHNQKTPGACPHGSKIWLECYQFGVVLFIVLKVAESCFLQSLSVCGNLVSSFFSAPLWGSFCVECICKMHTSWMNRHLSTARIIRLSAKEA